jgi:hypothetical protein
MMKKSICFLAVAITMLFPPPVTRAQQGPVPCCTVTTVNVRTSTAAAKINASGQTFEFRVTDPKLMASLKTGQAVYANFTTKQVSFDGRTPSGIITAGPASSPAVAASLAGKAGNKPVGVPPNYGPVVAAHGCPAVSDGPDLLITALAFDPTRHTVYTVANCGHAATQLPFIVDLFFNATRGDTVEHHVLPPLSQQAVTSQMAQYAACDRVTLRAVADPQQIVTESNEGNNEKILDALPPCADLAVDEIKQDWEDANTRYRVQITVSNHGTAPTTVTVTARANTNASSFATPTAEYEDVPPLAPGQSHTFHLSKKYALTTSVAVDVLLDYYNKVFDANKDNNYKHRILGPH